MRIPHIEVEKELGAVVRDMGGVVISDLLPHPNFLNADYVFHMEKVVAELKCVSEDNVFSAGNVRKAEALLRQHTANPEATLSSLTLEVWQSLPISVQAELTKIFSKNIRRRISKANRQVRETKECLHLSEYAGLLIIANDGVSSIAPAAFINAVQLALQNDFRQIRHFVYLTVNLTTIMRSVPLPVLYWISFNMEDGPPIDEGFLNRLGSSWRRHCCTICGVSALVSELQDMEGFWRAMHP